MKILVTGGSGFLGYKFVKALHGYGAEFTHNTNAIQIPGASGHKMDITDRAAVLDIIGRVKPQIVIHTSALTKVDLCEQDKELANRINIEGTENIVEGCQNVDAKIAYISTSNVFDGRKEIYMEGDVPRAINHYGHTKLEGEEAVIRSGVPYLIFRTDQPYGLREEWQRQNTMLRVLDELRSGKRIKEPVDWMNNPTYAENMVEVCLRLIEMGRGGIYHVVGSDYISRVEWSKKIAKAFGYDTSLIESISSKELGLAAVRSNANLSNEKAQAETGIRILGVEEGMERMKALLS